VDDASLGPVHRELGTLFVGLSFYDRGAHAQVPAVEVTRVALMAPMPLLEQIHSAHLRLKLLLELGLVYFTAIEVGRSLPSWESVLPLPVETMGVLHVHVAIFR